MFAVTETSAEGGGPRRGGARSAGRPRSRHVFRPNLDECLLEERITPIVPNLGLIVLTTSGYILLTPSRAR